MGWSKDDRSSKGHRCRCRSPLCSHVHRLPGPTGPQQGPDVTLGQAICMQQVDLLVHVSRERVVKCLDRLRGGIGHFHWALPPPPSGVSSHHKAVKDCSHQGLLRDSVLLSFYNPQIPPWLQPALAPPVCVPDWGEENWCLVQSRPAKAAQIHLQMQERKGILKKNKFKNPVPQLMNTGLLTGDVPYGKNGECRSGCDPITIVKILI